MTKREEEEGEEEEVGCLRRRGFLTIQKAPVSRKHHKIVYLGALIAGRAIRSGRLVISTLLFMLKAGISSHTFCQFFFIIFPIFSVFAGLQFLNELSWKAAVGPKLEGIHC